MKQRLSLTQFNRSLTEKKEEALKKADQAEIKGGMYWKDYARMVIECCETFCQVTYDRKGENWYFQP